MKFQKSHVEKLLGIAIYNEGKMLKQRTLLKSVIDFTQDKKELNYIIENFHCLRDSNIRFDIDLHSKIHGFICDHAKKLVDVPSFNLLKIHFAEDKDVVEELDKISKEDAIFASNFKSLLTDVYEEQQKKDLVTLLKETGQISETGKKQKDGFIHGPKKAVEFFLHQSMNFLKTVSSIRTKGTLKGNSKEAYSDYIEVKTNKKHDGLFTGLPSIDTVCKGIRNTELWLIMAYVSELKTTLAMNLAYTQAVEQGMDVKFISLEMPYRIVRDLLVCIHSANLNLWPGSKWDDVYPIKYDAVSEGTLSEREEEFFNFLCEDLDNNPEYGNLDIYQPEDGLTMGHLKAWAEIENRKKSFDALYLDYIELMKSETPSKEYTVDLNQRIKDLKQFALHFNDGRGLRIISAYQANRKGKEHADKNDGEYRLDALSYANEAERSADVIIYSYLNDELRENSLAKIGCLKNRSRPKFKQFKATTCLESRKIYECPDLCDLPKENLSKKNHKKKLLEEELINVV